MSTPFEWQLAQTRRQFFSRSAHGIGSVALASLLNRSLAAPAPGTLGPHFPPKAKRVIYLFMHGGPSQMDLFDYKPGLRALHGQELPASVRGTQRLTGMTSGQKSLPITASAFAFQRYGQCGAWMSELMPHTGGVVDDLCFIRSMHTEAINHDPAVTFLQTGHQQPGRPSLGAWTSYGLGSDNENLPAFVVLISRGSAARPADPLYARLCPPVIRVSLFAATAIPFCISPIRQASMLPRVANSLTPSMPSTVTS
jgi:hypothetical protein